MQPTFKRFIQNLSAAGIENPRLEARRLLSFALNLEEVDIFSSRRLSAEEVKKAEAFLQRRLEHEPLDKIIGRKPFYKAEFIVSDAVLSPRPDTEILVEAAVAFLRDKPAPRVLDLGTGSGCIILSILGDVPKARGTAVDISAAALQIAAANAGALGLENRIELMNAGWFDENFADSFSAPFELIVSNPPYIPTAEIAGLEKEVRAHDPLTALDGGADGLRDYRRLAEVVPPLLKAGGRLMLEVGEGQAAAVAAIFGAAGLEPEEILPDLSGTERCVILKK